MLDPGLTSHAKSLSSTLPENALFGPAPVTIATRGRLKNAKMCNLTCFFSLNLSLTCHWGKSKSHGRQVFLGLLEPYLRVAFRPFSHPWNPKFWLSDEGEAWPPSKTRQRGPIPPSGTPLRRYFSAGSAPKCICVFIYHFLSEIYKWRGLYTIFGR